MRELDKARAYAESLTKNAPDPVFVSDLEGKILQANDAMSDRFRADEVVEQSVSRFLGADGRRTRGRKTESKRSRLAFTHTSRSRSILSS